MRTEERETFDPWRDDYEHFGVCPICGEAEYVNVGGNHWLICSVHRVKWYAGYNLFSCWQDEDESTWQRNARMLEQFGVVEPIHYSSEAAEAR